MKSGNKDKYEKFVSKYQELYDKFMENFPFQYHLKLSCTDDKLTAKLFVHQRRRDL